MKMPIKGFKHSMTTRLKMSNSAKGKTFTKEHRKNISKNHVGMLGKRHSKETRRKIGNGNIEKVADKILKFHYDKIR